MEKPWHNVNDFFLLVDFSFAGGSNGQSFSGQSVFGLVEKADAKRVQLPRKVSMGSSDGDDGTSRFLC